MAKDVYIGIFAHPDDESFGPSGSFLQYIQNGADVHLLCATSGQSGKNPDDHEDIGAVRYQEWFTAGKLLGASSQINLQYIDGMLSNNLFHEIADKVTEFVMNIAANYTDANIVLVTFDKTGISGHIDHIVMSNVTSYVFEKLLIVDQRIKDVHYFCISENENPNTNTNYMYMPKGYALQEISIINDISNEYDKKKQIMRCHVSQREDAERLIAQQDTQQQKHEYFISYTSN